MPFNSFGATPTDITGYLKSEQYDREVQPTPAISIINEMKMYNRNGQKVCDMKSNFLSQVYANLQSTIKFKSYEIWGYANQILYCGQTIKLDGVTYLIKDISYESEILESIKSFNAVCVRFLQ
jgi:hypothetical protein